MCLQWQSFIRSLIQSGLEKSWNIIMKQIPPTTGQGMQRKKVLPTAFLQWQTARQQERAAGEECGIPSWNRYLYEFRPASYIYPIQASMLTLVAGMAVVKGVQKATGLSAMIKWLMTQ